MSGRRGVGPSPVVVPISLVLEMLVLIPVCNLCSNNNSHRKSVFSLNEVGQMNGTAGGAGAGSGGGGSDDGEMPEVHEIGEELAWTGR